MPKLTKTLIEAAEPGNRDSFLWDNILPRFGVKITPTGRKVYLIRYRTPDGRSRKYTICRTADMAPDRARDRARDLFGEIANGNDPAAKRRAEAVADDLLFENVAADFIVRHHLGVNWKDVRAAGLDRAAVVEALKGDRSPLAAITDKPNRRSWREVARIIGRYVIPEWEGLAITSLRRRDVAQLIQDVAEDNGGVMSNRVLAHVRKLFNWALVQPSLIDVLDASPVVKGMSQFKESSRDRFLSVDEIRALWRAAVAAGYPWGDYARQLLLTGQRRGEVARSLRRDRITPTGGVWRIPKEETKAGRAHELPLSRQSLDLIAAAPVISEACPYVLTFTGRGPISGLGKGKATLQEGAKIAERWTFHDLRRTFATHAEEIGIDRAVISAILNHAPTGATAVYTRGQLHSLKAAALQKWADWLDEVTREEK